MKNKEKKLEKIKVSKREIIEFKNLLKKYEKLTSKKYFSDDEQYMIIKFIKLSKFYKDVGYEICKVDKEYLLCRKSLFSTKKCGTIVDYVDFDK